MPAWRFVLCWLLAACWPPAAAALASAEEPYFPPPESIQWVARFTAYDDAGCPLGPLRNWIATHPARNAAVDGFILTDRPSFTNANTTVPTGWAQLESGYQYTYNADGATTNRTQNAPQLNLRVGLNDRTELRILWNGVSLLDVTRPGEHVNRQWSSNIQAGFKWEITKGDGWKPQSALITTLFLPSGDGGAEEPTGKGANFSKHVVPLVDYIYGWTLLDPRWTLTGSTGGSFDGRDSKVTSEWFQSLVLQYDPTVRWSVYYEAYSIFTRYPIEGTKTSPYMDGGVLFRPRKNIQFDWRAGFGLNNNADDFFTGVGLSFRY